MGYFLFFLGQFDFRKFSHHGAFHGSTACVLLKKSDLNHYPSRRVTISFVRKFESTGLSLSEKSVESPRPTRTGETINKVRTSNERSKTVSLKIQLQVDFMPNYRNHAIFLSNQCWETRIVSRGYSIAAQESRSDTTRFCSYEDTWGYNRDCLTDDQYPRRNSSYKTLNVPASFYKFQNQI